MKNGRVRKSFYYTSELNGEKTQIKSSNRKEKNTQRNTTKKIKSVEKYGYERKVKFVLQKWKSLYEFLLFPLKDGGEGIHHTRLTRIYENTITIN